MGTLEVYVWFEADPAHDDAVRAAFGRLALAMAPPAGSSAAAPRLLRRTDLRTRPEGPRATWMEVWTGVPAGGLPAWQDRLDAAAAASGAAACAAGGRHLEVFAPDRAG